MTYTIIIHSDTYDRIHYALVLASTAAALECTVILFWSGYALHVLLQNDPPTWHTLSHTPKTLPPLSQDTLYAQNGIGTFEELLDFCVQLGVQFHVCDMAVRAYGLKNPFWRPDVPVKVSGLTFVLGNRSDHILFI